MIKILFNYLFYFLFLTLIFNMNFANAECRRADNEYFYPDTNDTVVKHSYVWGSEKFCEHVYTGTSRETLTSSEILKKPQNGKLQKNGSINILYIPNKGFIGTDYYTVKVCGTRWDKSGCSTLKYETKVE